MSELRRTALQWLAPILLLALVFLGAGRCWQELQPDPWEPLRVVQLDVKPKPIVVGETPFLVNGLCNNLKKSVRFEAYLGARLVSEKRSFTDSKAVDLVGEDEDGKRVSQVWEPGCSNLEPVVADSLRQLTPGEWELVLHIIARGSEGELQDEVMLSKPFTVVEQ